MTVALGIRSEDAPPYLPIELNAEEKAVVEQAMQLLDRRLRGESFSSPQIAGQYFKARLCQHDREVFSVAFLDQHHRLISCEDLFMGTIDGSEVHCRVVARRALLLNAAAIICAHNHPSGDATPSFADKALTKRLREALMLLDVRLLDHFVVGDGPAVSMAAHGLI